MNKIKIICTVGPTSFSPEVLNKWKTRGVDLFRINMSHTKLEDIEKVILELKENDVTVCLDTEGSQIRTGFLGRDFVLLNENDVIKLYRKEIICDETKIYIRPREVVSELSIGDIISLDFNSAMLKVIDISPLEKNDYVLCKVVIGGVIGNNKGVNIVNKKIKLPAFSEKDKHAIFLGKKHGVKFFTLSFMDTKDDVLEFRKMYPGCMAYSKIETRSGVENLEDIIQVSDGILIDRGDLSRQISIERLPIIQKIIIKKCLEYKKEVFVATHVLESMCENIKPNRAEINDVINTLLDGATGMVLTKESAIGKYPVETVNMLISLCDHIKQAMVPKSSRKKRASNCIFSSSEEIEYLNGSDLLGILNEPHGGNLVDKTMFNMPSESCYRNLPSLRVDYDTLIEIEQIAIGTYSPLDGFMDKENLDSVLNRMRLKNDLVWTVPIVLLVDRSEADRLTESEEILIIGPDDIEYAILRLSEKYFYNKAKYCKKLYGTDNPKHPGVNKLYKSGEIFLAGEVFLLKRVLTDKKQYQLTPYQTRKIFEEKGWSKVLGVSPSNVIDRFQEFIQLYALEMTGCDGIFVSLFVENDKKNEDEIDLILKSYEIMIGKHYPPNKVVLGTSNSRAIYPGRRKAILKAICHKNYGCSHFIVEQGHTYDEDYHKSYSYNHIFGKFPDLGIKLVRPGKVLHSREKGYYVEFENEAMLSAKKTLHINERKLIKMLNHGKKPSERKMRHEISEMIINGSATR